MNSTERFSDRVDNYVKYRPGYPPEMLELFRDVLGIVPRDVVCDIGSGTGISAKVFLENGNTVIGVEPNDAMREASLRFLAEFDRFLAVKGTAEATTLADDSVDLIIAAQAFHWFRPADARKEFERIGRKDARLALIWNDRLLDADDLHRGYEQLLLKYGTDYAAVRHDNIKPEQLNEIFAEDARHVSFRNVQTLDLDGLRGRMLSSSYVPNASDERFSAMIAELEELFAKHAENGRIKLLYRTDVFFGSL